MKQQLKYSLFCLLTTTVVAAADTNSLQIEPAVRLTIPSEDGKLYEIQASDDLNTWRPITTPLAGTGYELYHTVPQGPFSSRFFRFQELGNAVTNRIVGLRELDLFPAKLEPLDNGMKVTGLRVVADGINRDDYLTAYFRFDATNQALQLDSYQIARGVGVFSHPYYAKLVGSHIALTNGNNQIAHETSGNVTYNGSPLPINLAGGQVISFTLQYQSADYHLKFLDPQARPLYEAWGKSGTGIITPAIPIFDSGVHSLVCEPLYGSNLSYTVTLLNCNHRTLPVATNGYYLSTGTLFYNSRDYAKFKIPLAENQLLTLSTPNAAEIVLTLVDNRSREVAKFSGLPLVYRAARSGDYYLFVDNQRGWGGSYSSYVTITNLPATMGARAALATPQFPPPTPVTP